MDIDQLPDIKDKFPKRVTFAVSEDTYEKLQYLKKNKRKHPSALVRLLLEEFFAKNSSYFVDGLPSGK